MPNRAVEEGATSIRGAFLPAPLERAAWLWRKGVDDQHDLRWLFERALVRIRHEVIAVDKGREAIELAGQSRFDVFHCSAPPEASAAVYAPTIITPSRS